MRTGDETRGAVERLLQRPEPPEGAVSPWGLERFVAGDLPETERREVAGALRRDPDLAAREAALRADDRAFEVAHPFDEVGAALFERAASLPTDPARRARRGWSSWRLWLPALAAAAALALWLRPPDAPPDANRMKGAGLFAWTLVEGQAEPLEPGATLGEGDRLQLRLTTGRDRLALLGIDGTGTVSRYLPLGGEVSAPWTPGQAVALPDSLALDDAPGPEVFVAFLSDDPLLVEDLEQALHDAAGADSSRGVLRADLSGLAPEVHVFWVEKELR